MAKVSIGISYYNAETFLADAIRSVVNQTYSDIELLLVDDGSTDNSAAIARSFETKAHSLSNITVICVSDGRNLGLGDRLNQMVNMATGEYFARMDADDIMHCDRIARQVAFLEENSKVDLVGTAAYSIDSANHVTGMFCHSQSPTGVMNVVRHDCFIHPTVFGRTSWFRANPYDKDKTRIEDYDLWMRTISHSCFVNLPEPLIFYRMQGVPLLRRYLDSMSGERAVMRQHRQEIPHYYRWYFMTWIKSIAYTLAHFLRQTDLLSSRSRTVPLEHAEQNRAEVELQKSINH